MAKIKVLYLIGQYPAINHNYLLAEITQLRRLGFDVSVVSVSLPDRLSEKLNAEERAEAARTYYLKAVSPAKAIWQNICEFLRNPLRYVRGFAFALSLAGNKPTRAVHHLAYFAEAILVGRHMRQQEISHVHANFSATVALIVARTFPMTMSFVVHGFGELHDPSQTQLVERIKGSLFVRAISRYARGQLMLFTDRSDWPKLIYAPLGIDATEFEPEPSRVRSVGGNILCVGRLAPEKGQSLLLDAIACLRGEGRDVRLRLVGDGPDRKWLEKRAGELGIASAVDFAGWADHSRLKAHYAEADLCVLPSLAEGIPIVLMEAMAMQVPCVAPRITGIPELIEHGVDGILFTVGDVEDMSRNICSLLDSPELIESMGRRGRARVVREYDMSQNTHRFASVLTEQLGNPKKSD